MTNRLPEPILTFLGFFLLLILLSGSVVAHGGSHSEQNNSSEAEYNIDISISDSVSGQTITGDIKVGNYSLKDVSAASFNLPGEKLNISVASDGYSDYTGVLDVEELHSMDSQATVSLKPIERDVVVEVINTSENEISVDSIEIEPEDLGDDYSMSSEQTSSATFSVFEGYTYNIKAMEDDSILASEQLEIEGDEKVQLVIGDDDSNLPYIDEILQIQLEVILSGILGLVSLLVVTSYIKPE